MKERGQLAWEAYRNGGLDPWAHVERAVRNAALEEAAKEMDARADRTHEAERKARREGLIISRDVAWHNVLLYRSCAVSIRDMIEEPK